MLLLTITSDPERTISCFNTAIEPFKAEVVALGLANKRMQSCGAQSRHHLPPTIIAFHSSSRGEGLLSHRPIDIPALHPMFDDNQESQILAQDDEKRCKIKEMTFNTDENFASSRCAKTRGRDGLGLENDDSMRTTR